MRISPEQLGGSIRFYGRYLVLVFLPFFGGAAAGQELKIRKTDQMNLIYYDLAHEPVSYHLTRAFENSLAFHRQLFNYTPNEPITVLLQDFGDYGHGGASTVPWNYVSIGIE